MFHYFTRNDNIKAFVWGVERLAFTDNINSFARRNIYACVIAIFKKLTDAPLNIKAPDLKNFFPNKKFGIESLNVGDEFKLVIVCHFHFSFGAVLCRQPEQILLIR